MVLKIEKRRNQILELANSNFKTKEARNRILGGPRPEQGRLGRAGREIPTADRRGRRNQLHLRDAQQAHC